MSPTRVAVVGGGIAGLAAAWQLERRATAGGRHLAVRLVEADARLGGRIATARRDGFLVESGPDSFIVRKPAAVELATEVGLGERLVGTTPENQRVWLLRRGRMVELPPGMGVVPCRLAPVFASEVLSWRGKLRLSLDLVLPRRRQPGDESLGAFLRRRFGREALESFAGPILGGIYSADPDTLSLQATFPHFAAIERSSGSLIRGLRGAGDAGSPTGTRVAPAGGMGELVDALVAALTDPTSDDACRIEVTTGRRVVRLEATDPGWRIALDDGDVFDAEAVILTVPAFAAAELLGPIAPTVATGLRKIDHVSTAIVTLAFRAADLGRPLDGYGFVVPAAEGRRITAATFSSAKFPGRAPAGAALIRVFLGGPGGAALLDEEDDELVATARRELAELWGTKATPLFTELHRHPRATPRYDVGHGERVAALEAALPAGIHLAGAAYHGLGLPDCIVSGRRAADAAAAVARHAPG